MNDRRRRMYIWSVTLILLLGVLTGCVQGNDNNGGDDTPVPEEYTAKLYFINDEYATTGDESLDRYLTKTEKIQVAGDENPWLVILDALKTTPEDDGMGTVIEEETPFGDVYVSPEDETLMIVDLESAVNGSSMQEVFFIGQIVETIIANGHLFQESSAVDKVQFLVEGEKVESLMGHMSADEPFTSEVN